MLCPNCRIEFRSQTAHCPRCGKKLLRSAAKSKKKRKRRRDILTPLLTGMLAVNLAVGAGIVFILTSGRGEPTPQPAASTVSEDIAEQTVEASSRTEPAASVPVPDLSRLQVEPDQPETIDLYLLAPKLRFGMDRQSAQEAVSAMNPANPEAEISTSGIVSGCTYFFDRGSVSLGQYAQTELPVRMTLYFKNDRLYQYALVFGQNKNKSVTASAIDASSMFTQLYDVCSVLFSGKPSRTESTSGSTADSKTANLVFSCGDKRMAMLGIVEYPNQASMNYCYLQYGSLEGTG